MSCDRVSLQIARRYELEKNDALAELKTLRRKLVDVTNDEEDTEPRKTKRPRIRRRLSSSDSDEEDPEQGSQTDDTFVFQAGHKFFLIHGPWVHLGEKLLETDVDEAYNTSERFETDESKAQGQLQEILALLQGKFEPQVLQQRWLRRSVRFFLLYMVTY